MESLKYNHNYLEYIAGEFSKTVLKIFQEQFLDNGAIQLSQEAKEEFVSEVIKNQFKLVDELEQKQQKVGDKYIDFFTDSNIMGLYACWYIGHVLRLDDASLVAMQAIQRAWAFKILAETLEEKLIDFEKKSERRE